MQHVDHKRMDYMYIKSELLSGSSGPSQQVWPTFQPWMWHSFWHENLTYEIIKVVSYAQIACYYSRDSQIVEVFWTIMNYRVH